jgi:hypothetical protein
VIVASVRGSFVVRRDDAAANHALAEIRDEVLAAQRPVDAGEEISSVYDPALAPTSSEPTAHGL